MKKYRLGRNVCQRLCLERKYKKVNLKASPYVYLTKEEKKARKPKNSALDYNGYNFCSMCRSMIPKQDSVVSKGIGRILCPCCKLQVRTHARKN